MQIILCFLLFNAVGVAFLIAQGSLHYRLATLGYQKRNTYGVETFIL